MSKDARASMSSAPAKPEKPLGFNEPFSISGFSVGRYAVHVINNQSSQNQMGNYYLINNQSVDSVIHTSDLIFLLISRNCPLYSRQFVCQSAGDNIRMLVV